MGNAQSAEQANQPHNRLVKPKTNRTSQTAVHNAENDLSYSSRHTNLSTRERQQIKSQLLSPIQTEFGQQSSSDGDEALGDIAANVQRRLSHISRTSSLSCFGGKTSNAARLSNLPPSTVSLVANSRPVDLETAIQILNEVQRNASPEDMVALQQALQPYASNSSSPAPGSTTDQGLSRRTSVVNRSTSSLTRRRSLMTTPGVATRNSPVEGNRRTWSSWKAPQLHPEEEAKWRKDSMGPSPLTQLTQLKVAEEESESLPPRAHTPADMEYSHLGSLQLGSLRIANGEPSPAASSRHRYRTKVEPQDEDYFAASDTCDSPIMMKPTRRRGHGRSKSAIQPTTPPLYRNLRLSGEGRRAKTTSRYVPPPEPETPDMSFFNDMESEPVRRLRVMNKSVDTLTRMADAQLDQINASLEAARAQDEDEGFVSDDAKSFRDEAIRMLDGTIFNEPPLTLTPGSPDTPTVPVMNVVAGKAKSKDARKRPPPKKADSGYSSGGSFKTKHHGSWQTGRNPTDSTLSTAADLCSSESEPGPSAAADDHLVSRFSEDTEPAMREGTHEFVQPPKTPASFVSQFSTDSRASLQRRLQRREPSTPDVPIVQSCAPIPEGTIPSIPRNVRRQFTRRLSEAPGMEFLTQTYPTKEHVVNQTTQDSTVVDPPVVPFSFPSPPPTPEARGRRRKSDAAQRESSLSRGVRRSLSLFRRKSKAGKKENRSEQQEENTARTVLDLGTTAALLGRSPYDIALAPAPKRRVTSPTHPHQLGAAMPRAKSMVNMDSETAARLARLRSKDRALLRPEMPPRPKSYYGASNRYSFTGSIVPPVPEIPGSMESNLQSDQYDRYARPRTSNSSRSRSTGRSPAVPPVADVYREYGRPQTSQAMYQEQHRPRVMRQTSNASIQTTRYQLHDNPVDVDQYYPDGGHSAGGSASLYTYAQQQHSYASRYRQVQYGIGMAE